MACLVGVTVMGLEFFGFFVFMQLPASFFAVIGSVPCLCLVCGLALLVLRFLLSFDGMVVMLGVLVKPVLASPESLV